MVSLKPYNKIITEQVSTRFGCKCHQQGPAQVAVSRPGHGLEHREEGGA